MDQQGFNPRCQAISIKIKAHTTEAGLKGKITICSRGDQNVVLLGSFDRRPRTDGGFHPEE